MRILSIFSVVSTLIALLVVMAIIAILAATPLPALAKGKLKAEGFPGVGGDLQRFQCTAAS